MTWKNYPREKNILAVILMLRVLEIVIQNRILWLKELMLRVWENTLSESFILSSGFSIFMNRCFNFISNSYSNVLPEKKILFSGK